MMARDTVNDGAVISTSVSQPYIYTSSFNSGTITAVNGNRNAPIGAEICYSGSYTGLQCGNIVTSKTAMWNFGGHLQNVKGMRTERADGSPPAGQGESGGPDYMLTIADGTIKRYAAGIISGGPNPQSGGCLGLEANRLCGSKAFAGQTWPIASAMCWSIKLIP